MAKPFYMTWVGGSRRWRKKYKNVWYSVSCRQLGTEDTKEASWRAANAWWRQQQGLTDNAPPSESEERANAFKFWSMVRDWDQIAEKDRGRVVDSLLGEGKYQQIKAQAEAILKSAIETTPPNRTVAAQVESWKTLLLGICQSGQISEGRFDAYCRVIGIFAAWIGPETAIDAIDETKIERFFNHLSAKVSEGAYAPTYAHSILMTAKQFVGRLAEMKLIPVPGNLRSRRFRFNHSSAAKIEVFTADEIKGLLTACDGFSERTKLYLLLMLNCGMYQNDIAELKTEEVNWKTGTITRARSKTRERGGPVVTYRLWPETFVLLKKFRASGDLVLTTDEGNPLVKFWLEDGKMRRYDAIQSAWNRLAAKMGAKIRLSLKHLRKTSATTLGQHPQFKFYANHFLADSPKGIANTHYVVPSDDEFFLALNWLREKLAIGA
ncbi:Phage integrase family protein [Singulisphaera sp. GP187]|uniref:tyrosine-type recombinase/integrase n=1 Tax=Singulisphaera sp. GP187 TaxID=1882752 RepID=UPI000928FED7|nr:tyrosine-type recombinase/integrase [Singulisphaera sp. GP187]SIN69293.1 Phage integrase family protein [Singulisphaera sp. GP187]